ncbi:hypothetical protein GALMADRAFT_217277 [Galerina marginata CBS 339.88]|uniref:Uncharacterized protein n=1 Tax=Galerina marginata (strain CBS 339.88) TaxID=685588 RepID=A0A067S5D1_GALM3|nr:hypothetical protein GALMADRAFT_217277 [Galerina marginata CBS 339.88]
MSSTPPMSLPPEPPFREPRAVARRIGPSSDASEVGRWGNGGRKCNSNCGWDKDGVIESSLARPQSAAVPSVSITRPSRRNDNANRRNLCPPSPARMGNVQSWKAVDKPMSKERKKEREKDEHTESTGTSFASPPPPPPPPNTRAHPRPDQHSFLPTPPKPNQNRDPSIVQAQVRHPQERLVGCASIPKSKNTKQVNIGSDDSDDCGYGGDGGREGSPAGTRWFSLGKDSSVGGGVRSRCARTREGHPVALVPTLLKASLTSGEGKVAMTVNVDVVGYDTSWAIVAVVGCSLLVSVLRTISSSSSSSSSSSIFVTSFHRPPSPRTRPRPLTPTHIFDPPTLLPPFLPTHPKTEPESRFIDRETLSKRSSTRSSGYGGRKGSPAGTVNGSSTPGGDGPVWEIEAATLAEREAAALPLGEERRARGGLPAIPSRTAPTHSNDDNAAAAVVARRIVQPTILPLLSHFSATCVVYASAFPARQLNVEIFGCDTTMIRRSSLAKTTTVGTSAIRLYNPVLQGKTTMLNEGIPNWCHRPIASTN